MRYIRHVLVLSVFTKFHPRYAGTMLIYGESVECRLVFFFAVDEFLFEDDNMAVIHDDVHCGAYVGGWRGLVLDYAVPGRQREQECVKLFFLLKHRVLRLIRDEPSGGEAVPEVTDREGADGQKGRRDSSGVCSGRNLHAPNRERLVLISLLDFNLA